MNKLFNMFNTQSKKPTEIEINTDIYLNKQEFIEIFLTSIYERIFRYCWNKTILKNKRTFNPTILNDCFLKTRQPKGFISLLSNAIIKRKSEIWIYDKICNIIETKRYNGNYDTTEKRDYEIVVDFGRNKKIKLLEQFASVYYDSFIGLANKGKINGALLLKIATLTANISADEWKTAENQAKSIREGINNGKGAVIDAGSSIELLSANIESELNQINNIKQEISSFFDGIPINFLFGTSTAGIGASGENDTDGLERAIASFFNTFWKPYFDGLFKEDISIKVDNWRQIAGAKDIINIVETTECLEEKEKREIILNIYQSINLLQNDKDGEDPN